MFKLTELINTESIKILKTLSSYVKEAFEITIILCILDNVAVLNRTVSL